MKATSIVDRIIKQVTPKMHQRRRCALAACIESIAEGNRATITHIGRGIKGSAYEKHKIKRADRLCSNPNLYKEIDTIYQNIINQFAYASKTPIILVDWSDADDRQQHFILRATLNLKGRGLTLYQEVHTIKTKDKSSTHETFLRRLKRLIRDDIKPIIVTDAGFRCPWFKAVIDLGWDYIGRVRNRTNYQLSGKRKWRPIQDLYDYASERPTLIGAAILTKSNRMDVNLVLYKKKDKGRHDKTRKGTVAQWTNSRLTAKREREPWLLATSLPITSFLAKRVVHIYRARMQIESTFRDMKSPNYGLGFSTNGSRQKMRIAILILLTTLASIILIIIGIIGYQNNLHRHYQANSIKTRAVLSFHYLGMRLVRDSYSFNRVAFSEARQHIEALTNELDESHFI